jgi:DNA-binding transcriptional MerR regulator
MTGAPALAGTRSKALPERKPREPGGRDGTGTRSVGETPAGKTAGIHQETLLSIGAAAARAGVTERALRYYQELGLLAPSAHTKGGMRRYSARDLERVARIRELQSLLGLNLDEIAEVLRNEDRTAEIRAAYFDAGTPDDRRRQLLEESLRLATELRRTVEAKRAALDCFLADLDSRLARIRAALEQRQAGPAGD